MPRKERAARPTRAEQLPSGRAFLKNLRRDYMAPVGSWAVDEPLITMHEAGLLRRMAATGMSARPLPLLRQLTADVAANAYTAALSVYRGKEATIEYGDREAAYSKFSDVVDVAVAEFVKSLSQEDLVAQDLVTMANALKGEARGLGRRYGYSTLMAGDTGDKLAPALLLYVRMLWLQEVQAEPVRPYKGLFIGLASAVWIDAGFPVPVSRSRKTVGSAKPADVDVIAERLTKRLASSAKTKVAPPTS